MVYFFVRCWNSCSSRKHHLERHQARSVQSLRFPALQFSPLFSSTNSPSSPPPPSSPSCSPPPSQPEPPTASHLPSAADSTDSRHRRLHRIHDWIKKRVKSGVKTNVIVSSSWWAALVWSGREQRFNAICRLLISKARASGQGFANFLLPSFGGQ